MIQILKKKYEYKVKGMDRVKLKKYSKYIAIISFVGILSINFVNNNVQKVEDKSAKVIIKSNEKKDKSEISKNNEGNKVSVAFQSSESEVKELPVPNPNSTIIVSPLS